MKITIQKPLEYILAFDWDKNESIDQTVIIQIDPMTVQLYEEHDMTNPVWTEQMATEEKAKVEAAKENELDDVPNTGSTLPIALMGLVALVTGTGIYTLKTAYSRK